MSCDNIFKDMCHIHARLFDHRSAFQGHINFFMKEFEEKRGDREKARLDHIKDTVTQTTDHTLPSIHEHCAAHLATVSQRIREASEKCREVTEQESDAQTASAFLKSQREARQKVMDDFMEQQCVRSTRVDQQYEDNVQLFNDTYHQLLQQLNQGAPFTNQTYYKFMALGTDIQ